MTTTDTISHGSQPCQAGTAAVAAPAAAPAWIGKGRVGRRPPHRRNSERAASEHSEARTSVSA